MTNAIFTVVLKNGTRYAADSLHTCFLTGSMRPAISFISSGVMTVVPAAEVETVEFHYNPLTSNGFCVQCDQPLPSTIIQQVP